MNTTGSANYAAIPIACLLAAGVAVFLFAAKINRPFLAARSEQTSANATPSAPEGQEQDGGNPPAEEEPLE